MLHVRVRPLAKSKFLARCKKLGISSAEAMREAIAEWMESHPESSTTRNTAKEE